MINEFKGNCIRIYINANELTGKRVPITLPDGYSYESIHILYLSNITELISDQKVTITSFESTLCFCAIKFPALTKSK